MFSEIKSRFKGKIRNRIKKYVSLKQFKTKRQKLVCHYSFLFIRNNGDVYPCCLVWNKKKMRICNIKDDDKFERIKEFYSSCSCERYQLIPGKNERININYLNIEFSLQCQASCAMCCVNAPEWKGEYNLYDSITELVDVYKIKSFLVQGGEVLVQKKSLEWIDNIKNYYADATFNIITNGNVPINIAKKAEKLFEKIIISFVGFQQETYSKIMNMNVSKSKAFAEYLISKNKDVVLKYLITPISVHEINLFLEWGLSVGAKSLLIDDSNTLHYINYYDKHNYWGKIINRSKNDIFRILSDNIAKIKDNNIIIYFTSDAKIIMAFDNQLEEFIKINNMENNIKEWNQ